MIDTGIGHGMLLTQGRLHLIFRHLSLLAANPKMNVTVSKWAALSRK